VEARVGRIDGHRSTVAHISCRLRRWTCVDVVAGTKGADNMVNTLNSGLGTLSVVELG